MYPTDVQAKDMILSIGRRMYDKQFVSANDGNITIRVDDRAVWATPTGVSKGALTPEMLIKVDFDGVVLEGIYQPTCELNMHLNIYRTNNEIMSTAHAHPLHMATFACAGIELDVPMNPPAAAIVGRVPVAPYRCPGTKGLADSVIPYVNSYHMVNLANHGPISWGKTPMEAWYRLEAAEAACELAMMLQFRLNGKLRPLTLEQLNEIMMVHHVDMSEQGMVSPAAETDNQAPNGIPFSSFFAIES